ncbi:MAG: hypothetical protein HUJ31_10960 [Pseudomonadales bacterium]|nr:hypothetical protein [Pseudomonadales bacterium]
MSIRLEKPWIPLTADNVEQVAGHMGVYQLGSANGEVVFVGMAGGRSLFGLRGELQARLGSTSATQFRYEVNTAYLTRYRELLMIHRADFGSLPAENSEEDARGLGRLSP